MDPVRILFVDDEVLVLNALRRALRNDGHQVFFTDDPETAFRIVADENIDIVVSDQSMPNMSGTEFLSILARLHESVFRVMLTGQADRETALAAVNEGHIQRFLEKPWDNDKLRGVLKELATEVRIARNRARAETAFARPGPATIERDAVGAVILPDD
jgi:DNA-binding NtrC family response regulator